MTAVASVAGENVLGNVAYEGVQQLLGEHKSVADYGLAAATGLIPAAISAPGTWRAGVFGLQRKTAEQALDAQVGFLQRAQKALGEDAAPDEVRALATQYEAQALREDKVGRTAMPERGNTLNAPDLDAQALEPAAVNAMALPERNPLAEFQDPVKGDKTEASYAAIEGMAATKRR